jgi:hypothetical protein
MDEIPQSARLLYFADLRPGLVYAASDSRPPGVVSEVVALAVREFPTVEGDPALLYYVLELDAQGNVVDDWVFPDDLPGAVAHLDEFPGVAWEELPVGRGKALEFIQQRLAQPPRG